MKPRQNPFSLIKRLLMHLALWIMVWFFFSFFFGIEGADLRTLLIFSAFFLPVTIVTTYNFIYNLIPNYLLPKHYFKFAIYSVYTFIISTVFIIVSAFYALVIVLGLELKEQFPVSKNLFYISITIYLVVVIASAFSLLKNNYASVAKNEELKNRILEAHLKLKEQELQYLKIQIHPHFLFNTLNTIYGFSLSKNEKTPEMILQLSDLLDYILYQTKKPLVKLEDEIKHIQNYIALETKRFQDALEITFDYNRIPPGIHLPPMLLLPFVENSFKHGKRNDGNLKVSICVKLQAEELIFEIVNSIESNTNNKTNEGIGLKNIKRRLDILYGSNYELITESKKDNFKVILKIDLSQTPIDVR
ncbi:MAG: histidine kinase [Gillisia sp.]